MPFVRNPPLPPPKNRDANECFMARVAICWTLRGARGEGGGDLKCAALSPRLQNAFFETPWYRIIFPKLSGPINRRRRLIRLQFWLKTQIIFWLRASWSASSGRDFLVPPVPQPYKPFFAAARVLPFGSLGRAAGHFPAISRLWHAGQCACREKWAAGKGAGRGGAVRLQNTKQHRCGNLSDPAGNEAGKAEKMAFWPISGIFTPPQFWGVAQIGFFRGNIPGDKNILPKKPNLSDPPELWWGKNARNWPKCHFFGLAPPHFRRGRSDFHICVVPFSAVCPRLRAPPPSLPPTSLGGGE